MVDIKDPQVKALFDDLDAIAGESKTIIDSGTVPPIGPVTPAAAPEPIPPEDNQPVAYDWGPYKERLGIVESLSTCSMSLQELAKAIAVTNQHPDGTPNMDINPGRVDPWLTMTLKGLPYLGQALAGVKKLLESQSAK